MTINFNQPGGVKVGLGGTKYSMAVFSPEDDAAAAAAVAAKAAADKAAADKAAADKVAADKAAADKAAADKAAAEKAEAERVAEEERLKKSGLSDNEAKLLKEAMKTKAANDELKAKLKAFEGIDPEVVRKMMADQADQVKKDAEARGDFERVKKMMADEHAAALKKTQDELEVERKAKTAAAQRIDDLTIGSAFSSSKFLIDETVLPSSKARLLYGPHFEIEDGAMVAFDKPRGESNRTKLVDAAGNSLAFEVAIKRIVEADDDSANLLRSKIKGGANSNTTEGKEIQNRQPAALKGAQLMEAVLNKRTAAKAKK